MVGPSISFESDSDVPGLGDSGNSVTLRGVSNAVAPKDLPKKIEKIVEKEEDLFGDSDGLPGIDYCSSQFNILFHNYTHSFTIAFLLVQCFNYYIVEI